MKRFSINSRLFNPRGWVGAALALALSLLGANAQAQVNSGLTVAYRGKPGDKLYLPPDQRVHIR